MEGLYVRHPQIVRVNIGGNILNVITILYDGISISLMEYIMLIQPVIIVLWMLNRAV